MLKAGNKEMSKVCVPLSGHCSLLAVRHRHFQGISPQDPRGKGIAFLFLTKFQRCVGLTEAHSNKAGLEPRSSGS